MTQANAALAPAEELPHRVMPVTLDVVDVRFRNRDHRFPIASDSQPYAGSAASTPLISRIATEETSHSANHSTGHSADAAPKGHTPWGSIAVLILVFIAVGILMWVLKGNEIREGWRKNVSSYFVADTTTTRDAAKAAAADAERISRELGRQVNNILNPSVADRPVTPPLAVERQQVPSGAYRTPADPVSRAAVQPAQRLPTPEEIYRMVPHQTRRVCAPCPEIAGYVFRQNPVTCLCNTSLH